MEKVENLTGQQQWEPEPSGPRRAKSFRRADATEKQLEHAVATRRPGPTRNVPKQEGSRENQKRDSTLHGDQPGRHRVGLERLQIEKAQQSLGHRHPSFLGASSHTDWRETLVL